MNSAGRLPSGARVFLHQAFRCCPYAGTVSSQLHDYLEQNGFQLATDPAQADVHLVNTCGSDARQAELTWTTLAGLPRDSTVVVTGCLVNIEPNTLEAALRPFPRTARFDPRHLAGLDDLFSRGTPLAAVPPALKPEYTGNDFSEGWAHVLASTGCLGTCSFCAIRRATGRPRSRSIPTILAEIERAVAGGVHDILLVSTDLSAWGTDLGASVVDLLDAVAQAPGDFLVSGESFEPTLFLTHLDALLPILARGRFAFLGVPIQSGSARVLRRMSRTYDPDDVLAAMARVKEVAPGLLLRTDLLYGFGDETEAEFEASVAASRMFDLPSFNAYQPRPGTPPIELPEEVLRARGVRALAELHRRAQAGVPTLRRWGVTAGPLSTEVPLERVAAPTPAVPSDPWDEPEGQAWIVAQSRRFDAVIRRGGGVVLGDGWAIGGARAAQDAVVLTLQRPGEPALEVGLRHPTWPGAVMARTPRFAIWVRAGGGDAEGFSPTPVQDRVLKRLIAGLGG